MYEKTGRMKVPTIFDRYNAQQPQCTYGAQGICCQLCSHGPCRITNRAKEGICGATADVIASRNFLRLAAGGAAAYIHHLELVMMDMNCSTPALKSMADHFHTKVISVDKLVRMTGITDHLDFDPEKADEQAKEIIKMAINAYRKRNNTNIHIPKYRSDVMAGFSVESCKAALGGTWNPLIDAIKAGCVSSALQVEGP